MAFMYGPIEGENVSDLTQHLAIVIFSGFLRHLRNIQNAGNVTVRYNFRACFCSKKLTLLVFPVRKRWNTRSIFYIRLAKCKLMQRHGMVLSYHVRRNRHCLKFHSTIILVTVRSRVVHKSRNVFRRHCLQERQTI